MAGAELTGAGPCRPVQGSAGDCGREQSRGAVSSSKPLEAVTCGHNGAELVSDNVSCWQQSQVMIMMVPAVCDLGSIMNDVLEKLWCQLHLWQSPHPMPGLPAQCNQEFIEIDRGGLSCGWGSEVCRPCNLSLSRPDTAACKIAFLNLLKLAQPLKICAEKCFHSLTSWLHHHYHIYWQLSSFYISCQWSEVVILVFLDCKTKKTF